ncbi:MAG: hypothetical protein RDV48_28635 [Candidatus Eremiobacteraeota bacterium]|nr:hypothetical protein [Candidatus Eremiobacteraeota bacterium]
MKKSLYASLLGMAFLLFLALLQSPLFLGAAPLLDSTKLAPPCNMRVLAPLDGDYTSPLWSLSGGGLLSGGRWVSFEGDSCRVLEEFSLGAEYTPFGFDASRGVVFSLKEGGETSDIYLYQVKRKEQRLLPLPVKKSWRKIRILDPSLSPGGDVVAVFQKESDDSNVKECYVFALDAHGKRFRQLTDSAVHVVKSKMLFMGKKVAYGKLRSPQMSRDGRFCAYLSLEERDPKRLLYDLCIAGHDRTSRVLKEDLASCGAPAWSPDGAAVAFKAAGEKGEYELSIVEAGGGVRARVPVGTKVKNAGDDPGNVSWSFDGEWIAFTGDEGRSLKVVTKKGQGLSTVFQVKTVEGVENPEYLWEPRWSPHGPDLAFLQLSAGKGKTPSFLYVARLSH